MESEEKDILPADRDLIDTQAQPEKDSTPLFQVVRILNLGWLLIPLLLLELEEETRLAWSALMKTWQFWVVVFSLIFLILLFCRKRISHFLHSLK